MAKVKDKDWAEPWTIKPLFDDGSALQVFQVHCYCLLIKTDALLPTLSCIIFIENKNAEACIWDWLFAIFVMFQPFDATSRCYQRTFAFAKDEGSLCFTSESDRELVNTSHFNSGFLLYWVNRTGQQLPLMHSHAKVLDTKSFGQNLIRITFNVFENSLTKYLIELLNADFWKLGKFYGNLALFKQYFDQWTVNKEVVSDLWFCSKFLS